MKSSIKITVTIIALLVASGLPLFAQNGDTPQGTERGTVEASVYTGAAFDLQGAAAIVCTSPSRCISEDTGTTHPMVGGQIGIAAARWMWIVGDFSYTPLGKATASSGALSSTVSGSAFTFHGAMDFQPNFKRFVPFGSVGWGVFHQGAKGNLLGSAANVSGNLLSGQVGGGARIYVSNRWGLKVGFYGVSAKVNDTGSISDDYARYGVLKAGVFFHSK